MASRDSYEKNIICPKCNEIGILHVSENDYTFMKRLDKSIDSIDGNFKAEMHDDLNINIICGNCGETFSK